MAKLIITRPRQYADMFRSYSIVVDGVPRALISYGETIEVKVPPGRHQVTAKIDWCRSNTIEIEDLSEGTQVFEVGSNISGLHLLIPWIYITIWRDRYLYLREAKPDVASWLE